MVIVVAAVATGVAISEEEKKEQEEEEKQKQKEKEEAERAEIVNIQTRLLLSGQDYNDDDDLQQLRDKIEYLENEEEAGAPPETLDFNNEEELKGEKDKKESNIIKRVVNKIIITFLKNLVKIIPFPAIRDLFMQEIKANKHDGGKLLIGFILICVMIFCMIPFFLSCLSIITSMVISIVGGLITSLLFGISRLLF